MSPSVAVIDIGSNSIKVLVACRTSEGVVKALKTRTIEARISAGISRAKPELSDEGMQRGLDAIVELVATAAPYSPVKTVLVATSAVRDAGNGDVFKRRVLDATGFPIRILTGDEEANFIGRGLTSDPALDDLTDFLVFDLGGGSLECLRFENHQIKQALSLQLGCVRLTERFFKDRSAPLDQTEAIALAHHVRDTVKASGFRFPLSAPAAVFTGGSMTTVRALKGAMHGIRMEDTPPFISLSTLEHTLDEIGPMTLDQRLAVPGMPAGRADVFIAALITMITVAEFGGINTFRHSLHNLRWGLAAITLEQL